MNYRMPHQVKIGALGYWYDDWFEDIFIRVLLGYVASLLIVVVALVIIGVVIVIITGSMFFAQVIGLIAMMIVLPSLRPFWAREEEYFVEKYKDINIIEPQPEAKTYNHRSLGHVILHGGAGQGKSALAKVLANEIRFYYGHPIEYLEVFPSQLKTKSDMDNVMLFISNNPYCVVFIDEIHGLNRNIEESMYSALQDGEYAITLTKSISLSNDVELLLTKDSGMQKIKLPPFTLVGATTLIGDVNKPLRDRFPINIRMSSYNQEDLIGVVDSYIEKNNPDSFDSYSGQDVAKLFLRINLLSTVNDVDVVWDDNAKPLIAKLSHGTARLAVKYSKGSEVLARAVYNGRVCVDAVSDMMALNGIDENGLDQTHRDIIFALMNHKKEMELVKKAGFASMSIRALANKVQATDSDIKEMYIPELTKAGYLSIDSRGMQRLTDLAWQQYQ